MTATIRRFGGKAQNRNVGLLACGRSLWQGPWQRSSYFSLHSICFCLLVGAQASDSIAVLPFANATGDLNAEYLSDGITESLINSLSQLPRLKVMSRNSVFRYKQESLTECKRPLELEPLDPS